MRAAPDTVAHPMASTFMRFSLGSVSRSEYRLACGLALSLLAHLLLVLGVRPTVAVYTPPAPLQVEIRHVAPKPEAPLSGSAPSDFVTGASPPPPPAEAPKPELAPPTPGSVAGIRDDSSLLLDRYYSSLEVDVRAEPLNEVDLVYPRLAYQKRTKGKVTLRIFINERGGIDRVTVLESEPRGVFEEAALTATRALQFSPATRSGRNVKSRKDIQVDFDPYESIHVP